MTEPQAVRARIGLSGQFAAIDENLTGRENLWLFGRLYQLTSAEATRRAASCSTSSSWPTPPTGSPRPTPAACVVASTWPAALVAHPEVLFLDEPTTGLDPRSRLDLWDVIRERAAEGSTMLLTTQYLEEADALADRIVVIDQGASSPKAPPTSSRRRCGGERIEVIVHEAPGSRGPRSPQPTGDRPVRGRHQLPRVTVPTSQGSKGWSW